MKSTIIGMFVLMGFGMFMSRPETSRAANNDVLTAIADYKSWGRVTKEPFRVSPFTRLDLLNLTPTEGLKLDVTNVAV
jgi:hypothetical protein